MKQVLSLLVSFVFLQTQTWAIIGGPFGNQGTSGNLNGIYAGVLIPELAVVGSATSIGLFTLTKPLSGLATGTISVFVNGAAFTGTISGVMDPLNGAFSGVIDATSTFQVTIFVPGANGAQTAQNFSVFAQGSMRATVEPFTGRTAFATGTSAALRVEGRAVLDISFRIDAATGTPIISNTAAFIVDGFKQADS